MLLELPAKVGELREILAGSNRLDDVAHGRE